MQRAIARALGLRSEELGRAAALFVLAFVLGLSLVSFDLALSTSLVVALEPAQLPWSEVVVGASVPLAGVGLAWLRRRASIAAFVALPLAVLATCVLALLVLSAEGHFGPVELLLLWATEHVLSAVAIVGFWTLASRTFDVEESRRAYGMISAGELVAGVLGGLVAAPLRRSAPLPWLLGGAMVGVLGGVLLAVPLARDLRRAADEGASARGEGASTGAVRRHGWLSLGYHAASNVTFDVVQFVVLVSVRAAHPDDPERVAAVLGPLLSARLGVGALVQLFVASRVLDRRLGLGLLVAPLVVLLATLFTALHGALSVPVLSAVIGLQIVETAVRGGFAKPALMAAQSPMPAAARDRTLLLMETAVEPLGTGLTGIVLLSVPAAWLVGPAVLFFPGPVAIAWGAVGRALARSYRGLVGDARVEGSP